jgi:predicted  nucleic acid-binding Zn-ribbon protein
MNNKNVGLDFQKVGAVDQDVQRVGKFGDWVAELGESHKRLTDLCQDAEIQIAELEKRNIALNEKLDEDSRKFSIQLEEQKFSYQQEKIEGKDTELGHLIDKISSLKIDLLELEHELNKIREVNECKQKEVEKWEAIKKNIRTTLGS